MFGSSWSPVGREVFLLNETLIWLVQLQSVQSGVRWAFVELSLRVVDLVVVLCGRAAVRRSHFSVDGCRDAAAGAAAMLVVVSQCQVQQAGAGGQVDVLHVLHLRPAHRTQLRGKERKVLGPSFFLILSLCADVKG